MKQAASWYGVYSRLTESVPEGQEEQFRSLLWAFGYHLLNPDDVEAREREGSAFGPMFEIDGKRLPPRLSDVSEADVTPWSDAFDDIDDPRLRSRMGDLLWQRRHQPRPDEKARAAVRALLQLADESGWELMDSTDGLVRALELARSLSDDALVSETVAAIGKAIAEELDSEEDRPGIPFILMTRLAELPVSVRPSNLDDLISRSESKYGDDPHHVETAMELRARIIPAEELPALRRRQVAMWRRAAAHADGLLRLVFLERALDVARTNGLSEDAAEIRTELGLISEDELDLKEVSGEIKIDREQIEEFISSLVKFDQWQESLSRFGIQGPPGGEPDALDQQVTELMKAAPLQFLVTRAVIDPDTNVTIFHAIDDESHRRASIAQQRALAARLWSVFATDVLQRFEEKYGRPDHGDLAEFFTSSFIDAAFADRIARAFELWWDERPDESAHILAPRLESVIREIARQLGLPIIREPIAGKPGGVRSLGEILHALNGRLPAGGWHAYLTNLLSDPLGLNLRNVIAHGLRPEISAQDAALLLHAACFLRLLGAPQPEVDENQGDQ